ncbi:ankyrin repeat protein [Eremomyces bilateralis CBS 781.70]|uniref:Ankyrin repeat protein n=1 Tax=Eremomyces bilateralis CBS 781.70 TaxID=1392243 RepID=A0A6G1GF99_9PEZI|nr:ankyrin repeat protein [Eremomyces bilateralis CBS 781.70]KAF1816596.1 ankyrin repeat protein [Eremomyces bilateralis CBS 781.70]
MKYPTYEPSSIYTGGLFDVVPCLAMTDPVSIAGLVIAVGQVATALCSYGAALKDRKEETRSLMLEVFALKGILESVSADFEDRLPRNSDLADEESWPAMVSMTRETLVALQKRLKVPTGVLNNAKRTLTWPFAKRDIDRYIASLERSKTWFLMIIMNETSALTTKVHADMKSLSDTIHEDIIERKSESLLKDTEEIIRWLAPVRPEEEHADLTQLRAPGSGEWFFDKEFHGWLSSVGDKRRIMWVTGKSGAGKTMIFSCIVEKLQSRCQSSNNRVCGFHYCSLNNASTQQPANVLGSILAQAAERKPEIIEWIRPIRRHDYHLITRNTLSVHELIELLRKSINIFEEFFILVDALNETPHQGTILSALAELVAVAPTLRVLITCTTDADTRPETSSMVITRYMAASMINHDIASYVDYRMKSEPVFSCLSKATREQVLETIASTANGMFRWAQLSMDHLSSLRTGRAIKSALNDLPTTLHETYATILSRIPPSDRSLARDVLLWLSFSVRPLTIHELAEAVVLHDSDRSLDEDCRLAKPKALLTLCQGLIHAEVGLSYSESNIPPAAKMLSDNASVKLSHDSIRTFLMSDWIKTSSVSGFALDSVSSNREIMRKCLTYLYFDEFSNGRVTGSVHLRNRFRAHPLLLYAAYFWPYHAELTALKPADVDLILSFFATKSGKHGGNFDSWAQFLIGTTDTKPIEQTQPLYYAASYDMVSIIKLLLKRGDDVKIDRRGGRYYSTPLFVAAWRGNTEAAKLLVEAGANPDSIDNSGYTCREMLQHRGMDEVLALIARKKGLRITKD